MRDEYDKIQQELKDLKDELTEAQKTLQLLQEKLVKLVNWEKSGIPKIWTQQSIGIISRYDFFDFFRCILQRLLQKK